MARELVLMWSLYYCLIAMHLAHTREQLNKKEINRSKRKQKASHLP